MELLTANPFYQTLATGAIAAAHASPGVTLNVTGPPAPNPTTEIGDLSQVVSQGVDGVAVDPSPASLFTKALATAAAQTRVATIDNPAEPGTIGGTTLIDINQYQASNAMLDVVFSSVPASTSGTVVLGNCIPGNASLDARIASFKAYLAKKLPHVKTVVFASTTAPTTSLAGWQSAYSSNPGALAFIGSCDVDGPSLVRLHQLHPGRYQTATWDIDTTTLQGIKNGAMTAAINEKPFVRGYLATALLIDAARAGKPLIKGFINVKAEIVTKHNVDAVIAREASPTAGYAPEIEAFRKDPAAATGPIVLQPLSAAYATK